MSSIAQPRLAITTDWLTSFGGAERVLAELNEMFPAAPMYTSVHDPRGLPAEFRSWPVRTTFLQHLHVPSSLSRGLLPLMPAAFARLDLRAFHTVLTISSAFSKNVTVAAGARNVCYCLTPPRYLWDLHDQYVSSLATRALAGPLTAWLRQQDLKAAAKVDQFIAISQTVADRIRSTYGRDAEIVYPPVDTARFAPTRPVPEGYFLVVSRLIRYKRIDLAIAACNATRRRLLVVGTGPLRRELEALAGPTVEFLGPRSDAEITRLMGGCDAFLFPGLEDFGISPVEAQAAGRPVIAYGAGGVAETVRRGITGVFFGEQTADALAAAIETFDAADFDPQACRENAKRFDSSVFRSQIVKYLGSAH